MPVSASSNYISALGPLMQFPSVKDDVWRSVRSVFLSALPSQRLVERTLPEITRLTDPDTISPERRPSPDAHVRAHQFTLKMADAGLSHAASDVYTDLDQAIRLLWTSNGRSAEFVFPSNPSEPQFLYWSDDQEYHVQENPNPEDAKLRILWAIEQPVSGQNRAA